ncbi:MAG: branched-chain amino acid ABC transporter permease [Christensenellales bacterium]|jgi:branched-chain amino acid transport system permease protein
MDLTLIIYGISLGMLYFVLASGFSMIFGLMGVLNFAHASLFMWAAYLTYSVYQLTGSILLGIVVSIIIIVIVGALMEIFLIKNIKGSHTNQLLLTYGMIYIFDELIKIFYGTRAISPAKPDWLSGSLEVFGMTIPIYRLLIIVVGIVVFVAIELLLNKTKLGMIIQAGTEKPRMVRASGIDISKIFTLTFCLGCALAALAGGISCFFLGLYPEIGTEQILNILIVVVIGGIGSFKGSFVAGIIVGVVQYIVGYYLPSLSMASAIALMILVLIIKPEGLFEGGAVRE